MSRERWEVWVDRTRCDGRGLCAELFPEGIALDDWGYPIIASGAVGAGVLEHAHRAVASCPVLALKLRPVRAEASSIRGWAPTA
jgi:ferredoxin